MKKENWIIAAEVHFANGFKNERLLARDTKANCLIKLTRLITKGCAIFGDDDFGNEIIKEARIFCMAESPDAENDL